VHLPEKFEGVKCESISLFFRKESGGAAAEFTKELGDILLGTEGLGLGRYPEIFRLGEDLWGGAERGEEVKSGQVHI
jgi:hypothetical protein